ncbi:MAG: hypothetical protein LW714_03705 [Oxalobacteraceae bacterium]|nr:hypothetical protein [Oxalobacteraceae bacterium]
MAFIVLSTEDLGRLDKSKKIIKARDVWAFHDACKAVDDGINRHFSKVEDQMVDLVLDAVRRIIDDYSDHEKIRMVVKSSLSLVRNRRQISIKIHPSNIDTIQLQVADLLEKYPGIERLEVITDIQLSKDGCVIESDIGQVEASMSGQIDALRESLSRVFGSDRNFNEELNH